MKMSPARKKFVDVATSKYGAGAVLTRPMIVNVAEENGISYPSWFSRSSFSVGGGEFRLPVEGESIVTVPAKPAKVEKLVVNEETVVAYHNPTENLVPNKDPLYVPFGHFSDVHGIIKSGMFYPAFVTGLSGNGKTLMVEQACAKAKREFFRVNITVETDEDDLLGHYALIDGNTVWQDGPVVKAMEQGAVLLIDEIDL